MSSSLSAFSTFTSSLSLSLSLFLPWTLFKLLSFPLCPPHHSHSSCLVLFFVYLILGLCTFVTMAPAIELSLSWIGDGDLDWIRVSGFPICSFLYMYTYWDGCVFVCSYVYYGKLCNERGRPVISLFCDPNLNLIKNSHQKAPRRLLRLCLCLCFRPLRAQKHMKNKHLVWSSKLLANKIYHIATAAIKELGLFFFFPLRSPKIAANLAWERGESCRVMGFSLVLCLFSFEKVLTDHSGPFVSCFFSCRGDVCCHEYTVRSALAEIY